MNARGIFVSTLATIGLLAVPALAETITHAASKVTIDVPAGWKYKTGKTLVMEDANGDTAAAFAVVPAGAVDQASAAAGRQLASTIQNIKVIDDEKVNINGMRGEIVGGDGRLKGTDIDFLVAVIDTPSTTNDLMIVVIAEDAKLAAHKPEIRWLFEHIKPM
jgi:predicted Zn-dependent protease